MGKFSIRLAIKDYFSLDGGIAFGGIPREKWIKWCLSPFLLDNQNRVGLSVNCFLITSPEGKRILVDASFGDVSSCKETTINDFAMENGFNVFNEGEINPDIVIPTHLHFDHAGGCPAFPEARHIIHQDELRHGLSAHPKTRSSYLRETIEGIRLLLKNKSVVEISKERFEVVKGITVFKTRGHTPGHLSIKIDSEGQTALIPGALFPTRFHTLIACGVGNDTHALEAADHKIRLLRYAVNKNCPVFLEHDHNPAGRISLDEKDNYTFNPL